MPLFENATNLGLKLADKIKVLTVQKVAVHTHAKKQNFFKNTINF